MHMNENKTLVSEILWRPLCKGCGSFTPGLSQENPRSTFLCVVSVCVKGTLRITSGFLLVVSHQRPMKLGALYRCSSFRQGYESQGTFTLTGSPSSGGSVEATPPQPPCSSVHPRGLDLTFSSVSLHGTWKPMCSWIKVSKLHRYHCIFKQSQFCNIQINTDACLQWHAGK